MKLRLPPPPHKRLSRREQKLRRQSMTGLDIDAIHRNQRWMKAKDVA